MGITQEEWDGTFWTPVRKNFSRRANVRVDCVYVNVSCVYELSLCSWTLYARALCACKFKQKLSKKK